MLTLNNVEVVYNDVIAAVRGISFEVPDTAIVALLGSNGAGKSTTLKAISGILKSQDGEIEDGSIEFNGVRLNEKSPEEVVRMGICQVPEGRRVFDDLTVDENIRVGAFTRKDKNKVTRDYDFVMDLFPLLKERKNQLAGYLSGGEQQMLAIGRGMMSKPKLMMLDEPSLGLAPLVVKEIFNVIMRINQEEGTGILLVEQNANVALLHATYGYIMENGKIVMDDKSEKLIENEDVKTFYLGLTGDAQKKSYKDVKHYKRRKRWLS
ncbi:MAG: ABC transporter ATP-binding protein [Deltaproteobacteria bacterium CG_4_9_14_3_um_filter_44_9]|nr:MAG: ABC transporter ATP-binding protein [Deltaproteobacteria bacterium CG2_30_43_15]PIX25768.1 MAG: ABC transporter ATP-binding protein [Deltaproteobacteria bacterium CG_4_8_14_3_um_filter_43_13]PIZ19952.1 MAG: ABC transporter ATP-binding protein [Deltaproteobacteria bacterium CG_4_10_14_0_8_um_filter_43_12]PJB40498.1 MAG: ABC transporter ATP-binding protein [Deltaproteobacteria bacterium CG_4_9_14_3_um_filter_44_9]HCX89252.1 ABC transporter ATP-binding protein [Deltaproteobacteria bacteriu